MATVFSTKAEQIHCALHLHYTSCKYDDLFLNVWKSKMTERELEGGKKNHKTKPNQNHNPPKKTLEWRVEGINLCKSDTAFKKQV